MSVKPWYQAYPDIVCNYRFVALNREVIEWDLDERGPSHDVPVPGGFSGALIVEWEAVTPVLVGRGGQEVTVRYSASGGAKRKKIICHDPARLWDSPCAPLVLPGRSLRGMIRAIARIITWSRLGPINDRHPYWRHPDYQAHRAGIRKTRYTSTNTTNKLFTGTGWLTMDEDGTWRLRPCVFKKVPQSSLGKWSLRELRNLDVTNLEAIHRRLSKYHEGKKPDFKLERVSIDGEQIKICNDAHLVLSGAFGNRKRHEHLFWPPDEGEEGHVVEDAMRRFVQAYSSYQKKHLRPDSNLKCWLEDYARRNPKLREKIAETTGLHVETGGHLSRRWDTPPGIPVYYIGDPSSDDGLILGMSEIMRVSAHYSIGQLAELSQPQETGMIEDAAKAGDSAQPAEGGETDETDGDNEPPARALDWADALFGFAAGETRAGAGEGPSGLKGRIRFGFATAPGDSPLWPHGESHWLQVVQMEPRPGYFPTYTHLGRKIAPNNGDVILPAAFGYDSEDSRINGRKRYPVRTCDPTTCMGPVVDVTQTFPRKPDDVNSYLKFVNKGAVFTGEIRFHNLHPEEFAALLWCLSLGEAAAFTDEGGQRRHSIGRMKGFQFGQLKALNIRLARLAVNPSEKQRQRRVWSEEECANFDAACWLARFETTMGKRMAACAGKREDDDCAARKVFADAVAGLVSCVDPASNDGDPSFKRPVAKPQLKQFMQFRTEVAKGERQHARPDALPFVRGELREEPDDTA